MVKRITAYIALGSNLGDRTGNIRSALERISQARGIQLTSISSLLENPAVGGPPDSPPFLNTAAEILTDLPPHALLHQLLQIERDMGRQRREKWGPRLIDLDLLLYGGSIVREDDLVIPHPLMHERRFVLQPLAEIAPQVIHPILQRTIAQLLLVLSPA